MLATPRTIAVTGAAGMLGYSLLFRIGVGVMLGTTAPIRLRLLELPHRMRTLEGVAMELDDCAFPLVESIDLFHDPAEAFSGANAAILVGANPRTVGMERAELLESNAPIFAGHGRAINDNAADDVRVLVVGNPVNTGAMIAAHHAPDLPPERFTALMRLDHNRALYQVSKKAQVPVSAVHRLAMWGNHSPTLYPDITHATVGNRRLLDLIADPDWARDYLIPTIANRGGAVLAKRGTSSQGSAANAVIGQMRDWYLGTAPTDLPNIGALARILPSSADVEREWTSAGIWSHGEYGVPEGLVCSFPVTSDGTGWQVVPGLELDDFSKQRLALTVASLEAERAQAKALGWM